MSQSFLRSLLRLPSVHQPLVSPNGKWVAWSWVHKDERANVYITAADGSGRPRQLTDHDEDVQVLSWAADSRSLVVESSQGGSERSQLFRVRTARGAMEPLTAPEPPYFLRGGDLHPNGRWLVYGANYDFARGESIDPMYIYRHDLKTGRRKLLAKPDRTPEKNFNDPVLNWRGSHVLYFRAGEQPGSQEVWVVDIHGRRDRCLVASSGGKVSACWMYGGESVLFLDEVESKYRRLGIVSRRTRRVRWLIDDPSRNIEAAWPLGHGRIAVNEAISGQDRMSILELDSGREFAVPPTSEGGYLSPLAMQRDGSFIALHYGCRRPTDLVRFHLPQRGVLRPKSLTARVFTQVKQRELVGCAEDFFWASVDRRRIHGLLYRVPHAKGTILLVHGGPRARSERTFDAQVQYLVSRGFNVLQPNYRGSTGYGLAFEELIKVDGWGGLEQEDIRSAIVALIFRGIAKPGRVGITGTSYGGYSAWHAITHFPKSLVAAAAPICGMTDLVVDYETTRPDLRSLSEEMMGGSPSQQPQKYRERSPINYVQNVEGKLLIVQGEQDPNVTLENLRCVASALNEERKEFETLLFADEGHGIGKPENELVLLQRLADFFSEAFHRK